MVAISRLVSQLEKELNHNRPSSTYAVESSDPPPLDSFLNIIKVPFTKTQASTVDVSITRADNDLIV